MYKEKKKSIVEKALKGKVTPVKVVNKVEIAEKEMPEYRQTISISSKQLPEVKNWKVGNKYTVELEIEQTGMRKGDEWERKESSEDVYYATFEINSVEVS